MKPTAPSQTPPASMGILKRIITGNPSGALPPPTAVSGVKRPAPPLVRRPGAPTSPNINTLASTAGPPHKPGDNQVPKAVMVEDTVEPSFIAVIDQKQAMALACKSDEYERWMSNLKENKKLSFEELFSTIADYRLQYCKDFVAMYLAEHASAAEVSFKTAFAAAKAKLLKLGMTLAQDDFLHAWRVIARYLGQCPFENHGGTGFGGQPPEDTVLRN